MNKKRRILATYALPYANGEIHLGHIFGYVKTDIWVRWQKMRGHECYYICGSDTHGTPIMLKARQQDITPEKLVAEVSERHLQDFNDFSIEFDNYYSTHNQKNQKLVEQIYKKLQDAGCITCKPILQAFDQKLQMFLPDRFIKGTCPKCKAQDQYGDNCEVCGATYSPLDLIDAKSVLSEQPPTEKLTEHYFFSLGKYQDFLNSWIKEIHIQPAVANKLQEWLQHELKDWNISRDKPYFGFQIPGTQDKYFYVWLDAPIGYMASFQDLCDGTNIKYEDFWNTDAKNKTELYHFVGKDIIYFHALFWPAILKASQHRTPNAILAHGHLSINGKKMSKSRGNFILARDYLHKLSPEYLRYYFASKTHNNIQDIDLNFAEFA
ncbi:MAG: methionine--tRNA ligase, partial [Thiotrichales bacterium]